MDFYIIHWFYIQSFLSPRLLSLVVLTSVKKKRGRPKQQPEDGETKEEDEAEAAKKAKRLLNRFNGMSVAEVMAKTLPDIITHNLDILIVSYFDCFSTDDWICSAVNDIMGSL